MLVTRHDFESLTDSEVEVQSEVPTRRPSTPKMNPMPEPRGGKVCAAEFFAGSARLSSALRAVGVPCASFDLKISTQHDFSNSRKVSSMLQKVRDDNISYAHFAPPCNSFSIARWPKLRRGTK